VIITETEYPILRLLFGTFSLTGGNWLIVVGLAASVTPILELIKWLEQRGLVWGSVDQTAWTFDQEKL